MEEIVTEAVSELWRMTMMMSPYLLLGFGIAGALRGFAPRSAYARHLGRNDFWTVAKAAMVGIPLPLCSCGVIPTAVSLRREGASEGATTAFLIATPQTGFDSIAATYSVLGLPFAVLRPVAAFVTSLIGGMIAAKVCGKGEGERRSEGIEEEEEERNVWERVQESVVYGFHTMLQDIGGWLLLGLVVAAVISVCVPVDFFARYADMPIVNMLLVLGLSVPMYLCATGSVPIALSLMLKGMSPGAALVLLMAGPASNIASILVVRKAMGAITTVVYLGSIVAGAVIFGLGADYLLPREWFDVSGMRAECCGGGDNIVGTVCGVVLGLMLAWAMFRKYFSNKKKIEEMETTGIVRVSVEGMMCNHCVANVEKALKGVEGVEEVEVSLERKEAIVKGTAKAEDVARVIRECGYEGEVK